MLISSTHLRSAIFKFLGNSIFFHLYKYLQKQNILVLTYHSVVDVDQSVIENNSFIYRNAVHVELFRQQIEVLNEEYNIIGFSELTDILSKNMHPKKNSLLITFDDGLLNNYTVVFPILKKMGLSACFFLPTYYINQASDNNNAMQWTEQLAANLINYYRENKDLPTPVKDFIEASDETKNFNHANTYVLTIINKLKSLQSVERENFLNTLNIYFEELDVFNEYPADKYGHSIFEYLNWNQAKEMSENNMEIGAHTIHHQRLTSVSKKEAEYELFESKKVIESNIDEKCDYFSFPYGNSNDFSDYHMHILKDAGYKAAFTQIPGYLKVNNNQYAVPRIDVGGIHSIEQFKYYLGFFYLIKNKVFHGG